MVLKLSVMSTKSCITTELEHLNPLMFWLLNSLTNLSGGCKLILIEKEIKGSY